MENDEKKEAFLSRPPTLRTSSANTNSSRVAYFTVVANSEIQHVRDGGFGSGGHVAGIKRVFEQAIRSMTHKVRYDRDLEIDSSRVNEELETWLEFSFFFMLEA